MMRHSCCSNPLPWFRRKPRENPYTLATLASSTTKRVCPWSSSWKEKQEWKRVVGNMGDGATAFYLRVETYQSRIPIHKLHPRKLTCPLKRKYLNRKYIFQPLIFRGHSFVFRGVKNCSFLQGHWPGTQWPVFTLQFRPPFPEREPGQLHPLKQTWNLKMEPWKRRFLLETIISRFHVCFRGCNFT